MILPLLAACDPSKTYQGVLVGNPGEVSLQTAETDGVELYDGTAVVAEFVMRNCYGEDFVIASRLTMDLLGSSTLMVPGGLWCSATVELSESLTWGGDISGTDLKLTLDPAELFVWAPEGFTTSDEMMVLQLGSEEWLSDVVDSGEEAPVIDDAHPLYDTLNATVEDSLALYRATDSGDIVGIVASASGECDACEVTEVPTAGGGCTNYSLQEALVLLFVPMTGLRRRRERAG